jgi:hypothetical protein
MAHAAFSERTSLFAGKAVHDFSGSQLVDQNKVRNFPELEIGLGRVCANRDGHAAIRDFVSGGPYGKRILTRLNFVRGK